MVKILSFIVFLCALLCTQTSYASTSTTSRVKVDIENEKVLIFTGITATGPGFYLQSKSIDPNLYDHLIFPKGHPLAGTYLKKNEAKICAPTMLFLEKDLPQIEKPEMPGTESNEQKTSISFGILSASENMSVGDSVDIGVEPINPPTDGKVLLQQEDKTEFLLKPPYVYKWSPHAGQAKIKAIIKNSDGKIIAESYEIKLDVKNQPTITLNNFENRKDTSQIIIALLICIGVFGSVVAQNSHTKKTMKKIMRE